MFPHDGFLHRIAPLQMSSLERVGLARELFHDGQLYPSAGLAPITGFLGVCIAAWRWMMSQERRKQAAYSFELKNNLD
jgi:hypothetical protein